MDSTVSTRIYDLLSNVVNGNIKNYVIVEEGKNKKGEGFNGEMCYVSLEDKSGGNPIHLVIKQSYVDQTSRKSYPMRTFYLNEICFYTKIWPCFQKIQTQFLRNYFDNIPKCFITSSENEHEKLVLENLRYQNFHTYDKKQPFNQEHVDFILKRYGKFHALSFAHKMINPEEFQEITKDLVNVFLDRDSLEDFGGHVKYVFETALNGLDPQKHGKVLAKFKPLVDDVLEIICNKSDYVGDYSVVLHGDCWSNNMMFKYNESKELCDMRLLDFQVTRLATPVVDLSYFLYAGVPREIFNNLDACLKVYHDSLSETLENFGLNRNIYPFEVLKNEWMEYCQPGFFMGLILWRGKSTYENDIKDTSDVGGEHIAAFMEARFDEDNFKKGSGDLLLHMYENDFL